MTSAAPTAVLTVSASIRINLTKTPGHGGDCKTRIIYNMIIIFTAVLKKGKGGSTLLKLANWCEKSLIAEDRHSLSTVLCLSSFYAIKGGPRPSDRPGLLEASVGQSDGHFIRQIFKPEDLRICWHSCDEHCTALPVTVALF